MHGVSWTESIQEGSGINNQGMTHRWGLRATLVTRKGLAVEPTTELAAARVKFCALRPRALVAS